MSLNINFFHGDKGGVGKSFMCRTMIDYMLSNKIPVKAIDTDTRNPDIHRLFSRYSEVFLVDLREEAGWAAMFEFMEQQKEGNFCVSLPAGIGGEADDFGDIFVDSAKQIGATVTTWWVLSNGYDSANLVQHAINRKSKLAKNAIAVLNENFGDGFAFWEDSTTREMFMQRGGQEMRLPKLAQRVVALAEKNEQTFSTLVTNKAGEDTLTAFDRNSLYRWLQSAYAQIDTLTVPMMRPVEKKKEAAAAE